ncbi:MAG: chromosome partitioning protein ParB [Rickettsiales bacterium]|nr:chromosome partitioning protein ParB [Rickettsiales bacterium]|tara:strand:+ start:501 stop:1529 length:1029 start_codon:yes stop_codon:yes gene_type:complete
MKSIKKSASVKKNKQKKIEKRRLGMGLSSLLSKDEELASVIKSKIKTSNSEIKKFNTSSKTNFGTNQSLVSGRKLISNSQQSLPIQFLVSGKFQPRKNFDRQELEELAESIKNNGVLQPILVRPLNISGKSFEIIAGERRWRASQIAKLHEVPVIIRDFDDETALGVAMIENLQRSDLNLVEEAEGYRTLMNSFQYTQEKLSVQLGKSRSHITNVLRILSLSKYVKRHITNGDITFGHARSLVTLSENDANEITDEIIDKGLSVRQTEKIVSSLKFGVSSSVRERSNDVDPNILSLERELSTLLGLKIVISHKANNSGNLSIFYKSLDQLQPVIDRLKWRPK